MIHRLGICRKCITGRGYVLGIRRIDRGTRYRRAGWAEFIRKSDMKVATRPRM